MQLVFALSAATATFFLVPRGVSMGEIKVHSERMAWNISGGSYSLNLKAQIPIYNPNYLNVSSPALWVKLARCALSINICHHPGLRFESTKAQCAGKQPHSNRKCPRLR